MNGPLSWMRVVDLTDMRGALCARILADLGADVIRVDSPREPPALFETTEYRYRNANKRGARIDLETLAGRSRLDTLLSEADVLVENFDGSDRERLGFGTAAVASAQPRLVHVALADLGLSGPRASWHLEALPALAASGALFVAGFPEMPPCNGPGYVAHDAASLYAAIGAIAAVLDRARHGSGQSVEVSVQEAALAATVPWSIPIPDYRRIVPALPLQGSRTGDGSYWVLPASDGWIRTVTGTQRHWEGFVRLLDKPDLTDAAWMDRTFRLMNGDVIRIVAEEALTNRTRQELVDQGTTLGTAIGMIQTVREFVAHPQTVGRGYFLNTGFPGIGNAPFASYPVNLSRTPASVRRASPAPDDGTTGFNPRSPEDAGKASALVGAPDGLLLAGVKVLEFATGQLMPELCGMLSDLGADVIKVESLAHPDLLRAAGGDRINCSFAFNTEARGRRSVALDMSTPEGRELAFELCAQADVIAENWRGGVLEGLGLGYDAVKERNPNVVYVSSQGYGRGGPLGTTQAYGPLNAAFAGVHLLWNHPDSRYPCGTTLTYPDCLGGRVLAGAVLGALHHRAVTGEGQRLEMAQTEMVAYFLGQVYIDAAQAGADPIPLGNRNPTAAPHGVYQSNGDDAWVAIAVMDDGAWERLCFATGWDDDWQKWQLAERLAAQGEIDARLTAWTIERTKESAAELLQLNGVSAMPVMGANDHHADDHMREREAIVCVVHPEVGEEHHIGNPIRPSRLPMRIGASARALGADTEEVLREELALSAEQVADLRARGVCR